MFDHFQRNRKLLFTPIQVIDVESEAGWLVSGMFGLSEGLEKRAILKRTAGAKERAHAAGKHPGGPLYVLLRSPAVLASSDFAASLLVRKTQIPLRALAIVSRSQSRHAEGKTVLPRGLRINVAGSLKGLRREFLPKQVRSTFTP